MSTELEAPPIDALGAEMIATLCIAGLTYLSKDDVESAALACDLAGPAFERISSTLRPEDRTSLSALVSELRMSIVKRREQ
jgi:hypothetical protein